MKDKCGATKKCDSYPFCWNCGCFTGTSEELQNQLDVFFEDKPYKVELNVPALDKFEQELYNIMESNGCKFSNPDKKCIERYIRSQATILRHIWKDEEEHYYTDQVVQVIEKAALTMKTALEQLEEKDVKFTYSCMMALGKTFKKTLETIERIKISNSGND